MKLTKVQRAVLLRCRYAERYDHVGAPMRPPTKHETDEEIRACQQKIPIKAWLELQQQGFITDKIPLRLTDAGRAALKDGAR